jgi:hypothetical protein
VNDVQNFISQLERQRSAIDRAISALREIGSHKGQRDNSSGQCQPASRWKATHQYRGPKANG